MKKALFLCCCIFSQINADEFFHQPPERAGDYSWEMTDNSFKRVAAGMVTWGIIMVAFTLTFAGFMPNSPAPVTTTGTPGSAPLF